MFEISAKTDIGPAAAQNDDRILVEDRIYSDASFYSKVNSSFINFAICDGVGGLSFGNVAAETALNTITELGACDVDEGSIIDKIFKANDEVNKQRVRLHKDGGLRTTLVGVISDGEKTLAYHVGDSRAYLFNRPYLIQVTEDHSLVNELVKRGELTEDAAFHDARKNIITRSLGVEKLMRPSIDDISDDFMDGSIIMLCSDGISDVMEKQELKEIFNDDRLSLEEMKNKIYDSAVNKGSDDNISLILVRKVH